MSNELYVLRHSKVPASSTVTALRHGHSHPEVTQHIGDTGPKVRGLRVVGWTTPISFGEDIG